MQIVSEQMKEMDMMIEVDRKEVITYLNVKTHNSKVNCKIPRSKSRAEPARSSARAITEWSVRNFETTMADSHEELTGVYV